MSQTLGEIVSTALRQAEAGIKVASLRDAPIEDRSFSRVDQYLAAELGQLEQETESTKQASSTPAATDKAFGLDDVAFAHKLAEALTYGASVVEKLAGPLNKSDGGKPTPGSTPAGGPVRVQPALFDHAKTQVPRPQASAHARAAQAVKEVVDGSPRNDEKMQLNSGPVIPSGYRTSKTTTGGNTKSAGVSKEAIERVLNSKIAQHKMLVSLGQIEAADAVYKEAADIAQNASLVFGDNYEASRFPNNEGIRNLTKAQARDMNQREAGQFFGEPVKRDNAVTTHLAVADGLKLSADDKVERGSARLLGTSPIMPNTIANEKLTKNRHGQKVTKIANSYHKAERERKAEQEEYRSSGGRGTAIGTLLGGPIGSAIGAGVSGDKHNRGRRAMGAGAGAVGGGIAGRVGGGLLAGAGAAALHGRGGKAVRAAQAGKALGGTVGTFMGAHHGNKAVHNATKHEKKAGDGTLGAAAFGAPGAFFSGHKENRGRRALGALAGGQVGAHGGAAIGNAINRSRGGSAKMQAARAVGGLVAGSALGGGAGNKITDKLTRKQTGGGK